jgi:hypothetical protein
MTGYKSGRYSDLSVSTCLHHPNTSHIEERHNNLLVSLWGRLWLAPSFFTYTRGSASS